MVLIMMVMVVVVVEARPFTITPQNQTLPITITPESDALPITITPEPDALPITITPEPITIIPEPITIIPLPITIPQSLKEDRPWLEVIYIPVDSDDGDSTRKRIPIPSTQSPLDLDTLLNIHVGASAKGASASASVVPVMPSEMDAYILLKALKQSHVLTSTPTNASTSGSNLNSHPWKMLMKDDQTQHKEEIPWDEARLLEELLDSFNYGQNPFQHIQGSDLDEYVIFFPDADSPCSSGCDPSLRRQARDTEEEEDEYEVEGYVASIINSFSANVLWVKIVSDQVLGFAFTLTGSLAYYVLHLIGLGHLLSTGEIIGTLWTIYEVKVAFIDWLMKEGYFV